MAAVNVTKKRAAVVTIAHNVNLAGVATAAIAVGAEAATAEVLPVQHPPNVQLQKTMISVMDPSPTVSTKTTFHFKIDQALTAQRSLALEARGFA